MPPSILDSPEEDPSIWVNKEKLSRLIKKDLEKPKANSGSDRSNSDTKVNIPAIANSKYNSFIALFQSILIIEDLIKLLDNTKSVSEIEVVNPDILVSILASILVSK
jgi:hypothetical protein